MRRAQQGFSLVSILIGLVLASAILTIEFFRTPARSPRIVLIAALAFLAQLVLRLGSELIEPAKGSEQSRGRNGAGPGRVAGRAIEVR